MLPTWVITSVALPLDQPGHADRADDLIIVLKPTKASPSPSRAPFWRFCRGLQKAIVGLDVAIAATNGGGVGNIVRHFLCLRSASRQCGLAGGAVLLRDGRKMRLLSGPAYIILVKYPDSIP